MAPRPERGTGAGADPFTLDLRDDPCLAALYLKAGHHDGYRRDQDPFALGITIEDKMSVPVDYRRGATLTYSLNAHSPWEGYVVSINGTRGRAELRVVERGHIRLDGGGRIALDPSATPGASAVDPVRPVEDRLVVQKHWNWAEEVVIPDGIGGHGGGDAILLEDVFRRDLRLHADPLGRAAGHLDGVRAVAVGGPVQEGFTEVTPETLHTAEQGYGFTDTTDMISRDRGSALDALQRDFVAKFGGRYEFSADVPNGVYAVTAHVGDLLGSARTSLSIEGEDVGGLSSSRSVVKRTFTDVVVTDGRLSVVISGQTAHLNGLEFTRIDDRSC
ncbi:hypothetical protein [Streptomyces sp. NPDC059894]|uniref:hypothetical protein n=1 Tax=unclassified Streptomyces TaxID=2593676 RepID=UPI003662415A